MAEITNNPIRVLGCDVAKDHVVVFDEASGETVTVKNKAAALRRHLSGFAGPTLVVCEATGGHELVLLELSVAAGFEAHRADAEEREAFKRIARPDRRGRGPRACRHAGRGLRQRRTPARTEAPEPAPLGASGETPGGAWTIVRGDQ